MTRRTFLKAGLALGLGITAKALGIMPGLAKESGHMYQVTKTDEEWRRLLTPEQYRVLRQEGTERPFANSYYANKAPGAYHCAGCDLPLFSSDAKYDSDTGWPSFWQPIAEENVHHGEPSPGDRESEVTCRRCDAHLGDLFSDGPRPTGLRYCIDSVSLRFIKFA